MIILDPALLGIEGQTHEATSARVKFNGVELSNNSIHSITGSGVATEGVNNNFALGNAGLVSYTNGVEVPTELTIRIYTAMAEICKGIIAPDGKWLRRKFGITIQLDAPDSSFPGVSGILSLPTLTTSIIGCKITGTNLGVEAAGGAIVDEWKVKPLRIDTPSGPGY